MSNNVGESLPMTSLDACMRSIQQEASTVCINRAQCALLAQRLNFIFKTLRRLPDPAPTPQMITVFASADLLIQRMKYDEWKQILRRYFTCQAFFAGIFDRIPMVWQLHSTASWASEEKTALDADEVTNAKVFVQLCSIDEEEPLYIGTESREGCIAEAPASESCVPTEEQVISIQRRNQLGAWKVSFEELIPPDDNEFDSVTSSPDAHCVFNTCYGYWYTSTPVVLQQLEGCDTCPLTPDTVMSFVQDMVSRARWCHPNIVPFVGAFTEKMPPTGSADSSTLNAVEVTASTPTLALGVITEDMASLVAQSVKGSDPSAPSTSYFLRHVKSDEDVASFCSLHDLLFLQRRRFTLEEAMEITLQVADALQYVLLDELQVPVEVATAWVSVSPSNIVVCPVAPWSGKERRASTWEREGVVMNDADEGMWLSDEDAPSFYSDVGRRKCVSLPLMGAFAVMYMPPVYVEGGPFSRWRPHPHAASPASYALAQLLIALVTNEAPYRSFRRQQDLAARVFAAAAAEEEAEGDEDEATLAVKVSIPPGSAIPSGLPTEVQQLCQRGMVLQRPHAENAHSGISLEGFREKLQKLLEEVENLSYPLPSDAPQQRNVSFSEIEMMPPGTPLDDYGELSSST
ncbi:hypothetical protein DQ04_05501000 [Trypanosoma grayi]|uniref:hypothetical protein n=1 Tax=Trypanosoma grayi TaxID=71804 RepID=UPI0004F478FC|nr:hypothetical protein DQ04_05501000 [Trypanosoma grayi]KEG09270.1 hypothetical protein DQ04_05501000 [Trypanosoma grayi]